jgi:hypothetical protein
MLTYRLFGQMRPALATSTGLKGFLEKILEILDKKRHRGLSFFNRWGGKRLHSLILKILRERRRGSKHTSAFHLIQGATRSLDAS